MRNDNIPKGLKMTQSQKITTKMTQSHKITIRILKIDKI